MCFSDFFKKVDFKVFDEDFNINSQIKIREHFACFLQNGPLNALKYIFCNNPKHPI